MPARPVPDAMRDSRGITGLETAIVLIAFVVVSSVFAFATLSTGLFSSDRSKETINAGLSEASGTLTFKGGVIAKGIDTTGTGDGTDPTAVDEIWFQVSNAAGGRAVDLSPGETIITYTDADQSVNLVSGDFTVTGIGNADSDDLVEPGEIYEVKVTGLVAKLNPDLPKKKMFNLLVKPPVGAVVRVQRTTPVNLNTINDLN